MMTCSLLDVQCHISTFLAGLWWLPWVLYGIGVVLLLVALAKVKEIAGWPGVFAVFGSVAYLFGYWRGKRDEPLNPIEHVDPQSPDAAPSHGFNDLIKPRSSKPHNPAGKPIGDDWFSRVKRGEPYK